MTSVSNLGDGIYAVNTGDRTIILQDKDGDGKVDKVAFAKQAGAEILFGEIGRENATLIGAHGDPHLHSRYYDSNSVTALKQSADSLYQDIKDGQLDNQQNLSSAANQLETGGKCNQIVDAHADLTLKNQSMTAVLDVKTAASNPNVAVTEDAFFTFGNKVVAIKNVWKESETDGGLSVVDNADASHVQSKATFVNVNVNRGTQLGIEGTNTNVFDSEVSAWKYGLDINGKIHLEHSIRSDSWFFQQHYSRFYDNSSGNKFFKEDEEKRKKKDN
jgi:hypothetical protein